MINNSTFMGNTVATIASGGGAIRYGSTGPLTINNSTFSGNSASASNTFGGAIYSID